MIKSSVKSFFHFVFSAVERFHSFFFCLRRRIILFVSDGILFANSWEKWAALWIVIIASIS